jgi:hypothetical protein
MRRMVLAAGALALAACASFNTPAGSKAEPDWPFPVERGSALPPPEAQGDQAAPPEGRGPGGTDFGPWRSVADPETYSNAFGAALGPRLAGKSRAAVEASLASDGFACEQGSRLDCRIEIRESGCAYDWYVVREDDAAEPAIGFEKACAEAR